MNRCFIFLFCLFVSVVLQAQEHSYKLRTLNSQGNVYYPNEPSVCIDRSDLGTRVAAANIDFHFRSADSGNIWDESRVKSSLGVWGDPVLHSTRNGDIFLCHLSRTSSKMTSYGFIDRIVVQRSDDGGKSFNDGKGVGFNGDKMQDKPWLSSDELSNSYKGNLYMSWTEFDKINSKKKVNRSRIRFSASQDKGDTWRHAITISDTTGGSLDDDNTLEGATTAVDSDGNIYCVWAGFNKLFFDRSTDGGITWGADKVIANQKSGWVMEIDHVYRSNGMPFLLVDNSGGKFDGRLYVVYGDTAGGDDADIYHLFSDDGGMNWSQPERINEWNQDNNLKEKHLLEKGDQFMPNAVIDQATGELFVVYRDRHECKYNVFTHTYLARSNNGGDSWSFQRLSERATAPRGATVFSGDYIDIDAYNNEISTVWTEFNKNSEVVSSSFNSKVFVTNAPKQQYFSSYYLQKQKGKWQLYVSQTDQTPIILEVLRKRFLGKDKQIRIDSILPEESDWNYGTAYKRLNMGRLWRKRVVLTLLDTEGVRERHSIKN